MTKKWLANLRIIGSAKVFRSADNLLASCEVQTANECMRLRLCGVFFSLVLLTVALAHAEDLPNQLSDAEKAAGWVLLFDGKTTGGWHSFHKLTFPSRGWSVQ